MTRPQHSIATLAERIHARLDGSEDPSVMLHGVNTLDAAQPGEISFINHVKYLDAWQRSEASAAVVAEDLNETRPDDRPWLRVKNVDLAMAEVLELFAEPWPQPAVGVHPTAVIDPEAQVASTARIGPMVYVAAGCVIEQDVILHSHTSIGENSHIGAGTIIFNGTVIRHGCRVGRQCILHANVTLGADGFGYRPNAQNTGLVKIPHIGSVVIGDDVEIGANTCIDRGKFGPTRIGDQCKIDNLCQIAHNCTLGRAVIVAGQTAIAGSARLDDGVVIGGGAGIKDHIHIGAGATLAARSALMNDIPAGETWAGVPAAPSRQTMRQFAAVAKLPDLMRQMKKNR